MRDPLVDPRTGDIVRSCHYSIGERHVLFANEVNVRYLAVRVGRDSREVNCLPPSRKAGNFFSRISA